MVLILLSNQKLVLHHCMHIMKVKSDYLVVFLAKHNHGSDWSHITHAEKAAADAKKKADEPKFDEKADPSAGLMNVSEF